MKNGILSDSCQCKPKMAFFKVIFLLQMTYFSVFVFSFVFLKGLWSKSVVDTIFSGLFVGGLHVSILNVDGKNVLFTIQLLSQAPFHALECAEQRLWSTE